MLVLEERVNCLETVFERFLINNEKTLRRRENLMSDMRRQADKDREQAERDREQAERDREQIRQILQRMERFEQQVDQDRKEDRKEWNKKWGELANRRGTLAEDIVAPNIPRLARQQFGCSDTPDDFMIRRWIRHKTDNSKRREFDVVAVYYAMGMGDETMQLLNLEEIAALRVT